MDRSCVNRLKNLMIFLNFLCWLCGAFVVAFGIFQAIHSKFASLVTTFWPIYPANTLVVTGTIVTCVCYLGVLGAMKENRCLLPCLFICPCCGFFFFFFFCFLHLSLTFFFTSDQFRCCGVRGEADWMGKVPISCLPHHHIFFMAEKPIMPIQVTIVPILLVGEICLFTVQGTGILQITEFLSTVQIDTYFEKDLTQSLAVYRQSGPGENQTIKEDFDAVQHLVIISSLK
uniref:Uncharacterized protein n=1 Tax=Hippocampus comes TaxID=109280 RepID=A0A3Q2XMK6_HIPCM